MLRFPARSVTCHDMHLMCCRSPQRWQGAAPQLLQHQAWEAACRGPAPLLGVMLVPPLQCHELGLCPLEVRWLGSCTLEGVGPRSPAFVGGLVS